jgi:hypothetical protein
MDSSKRDPHTDAAWNKHGNLETNVYAHCIAGADSAHLHGLLVFESGQGQLEQKLQLMLHLCTAMVVHNCTSIYLMRCPSLDVGAAYGCCIWVLHDLVTAYTIICMCNMQ